MKTRLLFLFIITSTLSFTQISTNGLLRTYNFNNGGFSESVNNADFIQVGTNLSAVSDRFGSNNSVELNGDLLKSTTFSFSSFSISFWIKTSINDANERTIFDKSERSTATFNAFSGTENGFYIYLKDGRIGVRSSRRVVANNNTGAVANFLGNRFFAKNIADGTWNHIVITIQKEQTQFNTSSGRNTYPYTYNYYVDNVLEQTSTENVQVGGIFTGRDLSRPVDFRVANIGTENLASNLIFEDALDDIRIYSRALSSAEVVPLFNESSSLSNNDFDTQKVEIKLYPNPATNYLSIDVNNLAIESLEVYDMLGKRLLSTTQTKINISNFKQGVYLIRIEDESGATQTKRFIKK